MIRRLVQLTVLSLMATVALVASVPEKRTATMRLELWVLAALAGALLLHFTRQRLPLVSDPLARPSKPEVPPGEPFEVESLAVAFALAPSSSERVRRSAQIQLRDALVAAGAPVAERTELPATLDAWSALLDELEAS
jgi:hypothetical protein